MSEVTKENRNEYVSSKSVNLKITRQKFTIKKPRVENGVEIPYDENTVMEMYQYFIGRFLVCIYVKMQLQPEDVQENSDIKYVYRMKSMNPLRSDHRLKYIHANDEDKVKKLCEAEVKLFIQMITGQVREDEFTKVMDKQVTDLVQQRQFTYEHHVTDKLFNGESLSEINIDSLYLKSDI